MNEPQITREDGPTKGRYVARVDGIDAEAQLTYSRAGPKLLIADHTEVPDVFRGKGGGAAARRPHGGGCTTGRGENPRALSVRECGADQASRLGGRVPELTRGSVFARCAQCVSRLDALQE